MFIFSQTWLVPFLYLAVMLAVYLFAPSARRAAVQLRMRENPNLYLICNILLVPFAIAATLDWRRLWFDYLAWIALAILLLVSIAAALKEPAVEERSEPPPL